MRRVTAVSARRKEFCNLLADSTYKLGAKTAKFELNKGSERADFTELASPTTPALLS